jgi:hypothetical protein
LGIYRAFIFKFTFVTAIIAVIIRAWFSIFICHRDIVSENGREFNRFREIIVGEWGRGVMGYWGDGLVKA